MFTMHRGVFITFEGGEGAGKTTLIDGIASQLAADSYHVVKTREPGGTRLGEHIRSVLLDHASGHPLSIYAELCLFLAARAQHIEEVIAPAIEQRKIVLCDRFNDSTIAYQGMARGLGEKEVTQFCNFISHGVQPQLTIYLDIDPAVGLARVRKEATGKEFDRIESEGIAFHQKIRSAYATIAAQNVRRFVRLDATKQPGMILTEAMKLIRALLK